MQAQILQLNYCSGDVFIYCDTSQFYLEDNHVQLQAVESRDYKMSSKTLKKHASRIGIPNEIDVRAAQNALETSLSDLSEEARAEVSGQKEPNPVEDGQDDTEEDISSVKSDAEDENTPDSGKAALIIRSI